MSDDTENELAALKPRVAELERSKVESAPAPKPFDPTAAARWRDEMHQMAERRASNYGGFSRADLRAFSAAAPDDVVKGIALRDARLVPTSSRPGMIPSSQQPTSVRPVGSGSGWVAPAPLGPPPGVAQADRLMAHEDLEFRRQKIREAAELQAFEKIAAEKK
jgi:hypothetical protein